MRRALFAVMTAWPLAAPAETLYVIDRLVIGLRSDVTEAATVVKSVETGTALEVLERDGTRVKVREPQGAEGWIDARYLSPQAPARVLVAELQAEVRRLRAETARPAPAKDDGAPKIAQLETQLKEVNTKLAQAQTDLEQTRAAQADARQTPAPKTNDSARWPTALWVAIGFAMLGIGFLAGIIWVRESIRRRMGGMYLRI